MIRDLFYRIPSPTVRALLSGLLLTRLLLTGPGPSRSREYWTSSSTAMTST
jgi:hypothetical protein